jgi:exodeoxyribonuclease VII large subunit
MGKMPMSQSSTMTSFFEFREKMMRKGEDPPPAPVPPPSSNAPTPLTVTQLTHQIDRVIRAGMPQEVMVRGECSNCHAARDSGHFYFTLKDAKSCIDCVMYRDDFALIGFEPGDGIELLATGSVKVFAAKGRYQLYAKMLEPLGKGALDLAFQKLHKKLEQEGLFDPQRKKPLPRYPIDIALITSRATAALQDITKVLRRFPWLKARLIHVPVQGDGAAQRMAGAIQHVNRRGPGKTDVILLARGGGSLEDLWQFNDEGLARAIAASQIPIVTGIGHEIDTSIADLVADYHAHTPTESAQVITIHWRSAPDDVASLALRLRGVMRHVLNDARHRLSHIERHETFRRPMDRIRQLQQLLDDSERSLALAMSDHLNAMRRRLRSSEQRLESRAHRRVPLPCDPAPRHRRLAWLAVILARQPAAIFGLLEHIKRQIARVRREEPVQHLHEHALVARPGQRQIVLDHRKIISASARLQAAPDVHHLRTVYVRSLEDRQRRVELVLAEIDEMAKRRVRPGERGRREESD